MRRTLLALVTLGLLATGCRKGVELWTSCDPGADPTGTDGTYVMLCRNGRWEPIMTVADYAKRLRGDRGPLTPVPTAPTTTAKPATTTSTTTSSTTSTTPTTTSTTTTSTTTTTTTVPDPWTASVTLTYEELFACEEVTLANGAFVGLCQAGSEPNASFVVAAPAVGICGLLELEMHPIVSVTGVLSQGDDEVSLDESTATFISEFYPVWRYFDIADGPITATVEVSLSPTTSCF